MSKLIFQRNLYNTFPSYLVMKLIFSLLLMKVLTRQQIDEKLQSFHVNDGKKYELFLIYWYKGTIEGLVAKISKFHSFTDFSIM